MQIEISKKQIFISLIAICLLGSGGYLMSPLSPYATESNATCAERDGLTAERFEELTKTLDEIKEKAGPLSTYDWQEQSGVAFIQIMFILNNQIAEFEPRVSPIVATINQAGLCKNNNQYSVKIKQFKWSLEGLVANLETASGYDIYDFPAWRNNTSKVLSNISEFEEAYADFFTAKP